MRIWIINPFDDLPCEGKAQRFWSLSATLADQGHEVIWWSSDWSHRRKAKRVGLEDLKDLKVGKCEGEKVGKCEEMPTNAQRSTLNFQLRLVATPPYRKNISLARIWNHRVFGRTLYRDACAAIDSGSLAQPDVILASLPPMEGPIVALRLRARYGCRVITDVMDAWPETLLQAVSGPPRPLSTPPSKGVEWLMRLGRLALWPYYRMLRRACRESDAVSAQSEAFAAFAKAHGAPGAVHVCYLGGAVPADSANSANVEHRTSNVEGRTNGSANVELGTRNVVGTSGHPSFTTAPKGIIKATDGANSEVSTPNQQPRKLRLLYLGAMGRSYDLDTILDALELLDQEGLSVECVFVGDGEKRAQLEARQVPGVRFTGFLEGEALERELRSADVGIVPFFPESGVVVPYKAGDYLAYHLPLLSTIDGELGRLIRTHDCGIVYEAGHTESLVAAIHRYADDVYLLNQATLGARECFESKFDRKQIYPAFADWMVSQS